MSETPPNGWKELVNTRFSDLRDAVDKLGAKLDTLTDRIAEQARAGERIGKIEERLERAEDRAQSQAEKLALFDDVRARQVRLEKQAEEDRTKLVRLLAIVGTIVTLLSGGASALIKSLGG